MSRQYVKVFTFHLVSKEWTPPREGRRLFAYKIKLYICNANHASALLLYVIIPDVKSLNC